LTTTNIAFITKFLHLYGKLGMYSTCNGIPQTHTGIWKCKNNTGAWMSVMTQATGNVKMTQVPGSMRMMGYNFTKLKQDNQNIFKPIYDMRGHDELRSILRLGSFQRNS
jgi:hypothetical protein